MNPRKDPLLGQAFMLHWSTYSYTTLPQRSGNEQPAPSTAKGISPNQAEPPSIEQIPRLACARSR